MKTIRIPLHVVDPNKAVELLDLVTGTEGVVAAFLDIASATLEVVLSRNASALLVREQLLALPSA